MPTDAKHMLSDNRWAHGTHAQCLVLVLFTEVRTFVTPFTIIVLVVTLPL